MTLHLSERTREGWLVARSTAATTASPPQVRFSWHCSLRRRRQQARTACEAVVEPCNRRKRFLISDPQCAGLVGFRLRFRKLIFGRIRFRYVMVGGEAAACCCRLRLRPPRAWVASVGREGGRDGRKNGRGELVGMCQDSSPSVLGKATGITHLVHSPVMEQGDARRNKLGTASLPAMGDLQARYRPR